MKETLSVEIKPFTSDGQGVLLCPVCKDGDFVHHLNSVAIKDGMDNYAASKKCRGSCILIPMKCENGCKFSLILGFHKGQVFVWAEARKTMAGEDEINDR